mmetsp:Transcript_32876/g.55426  ORF Transcript_32876/g.55426 Transcript_32876/m.55426 type:complete len:296 (+) Transcript_32876:3-890(+)
MSHHGTPLQGSGGVQYRKPWKRILYEKQSYRDNYIDPFKFLEQLDVRKRNGDVLTFATLFIGASVVAQQLTVIASFLTVYKYILLQETVLKSVVLLDALLLIIGLTVQLFLGEGKPKIWQSLQTVLLFGILLRISAPVLHTLTSSFSQDTIHALAITFSVVHLVFHDYAYINSQTGSFSAGTLSVNAAIFVAIILASRVSSIEMVVAFLLLAVICFYLFPSTARLVNARSLRLHLFVIILHWFLTSWFLFQLDFALFVAYEVLMMMVWILGPYLFYSMQIYKKSMHGPWNIAEVD